MVNTGGGPASLELKTGMSGEFADAVTGAGLRVDGGKAKFELRPYQLKVYLAK